MPRFIALTALLPFAVFGACVRIDYVPYRGAQEWPTGSAFVHDVDGVEVYEGLPTRNYQVVGLIDIYDDAPFFHSDDVKKRVLKLMRERGSDALVWLSERSIMSGSLRMQQTQREPSFLDAGRSTQPEVVITTGNQNSTVSARKVLRGTVLVISWV
jgi:hypothetical protein